MQSWLVAFRVVGVGFYIAFCLLVGIFGGVYLDRTLGTFPLLTLGGLVLGLVAAFYGVYKMVAPLLKEAGKSDKNKHVGPGA